MKKNNKFRIFNVTTFIIEVILFWIIWFIYGYTWVNNFHTIANILNIVTIIGMVLIVMTGILIAIRLVRDIDSEKSVSFAKRLGTIILFVVFIAIHTLMYKTYGQMGYQTVTTTSIVNKDISQGEYYFYIKKSAYLVKIECTKDIYDQLIVDKDVSYMVSYRWLTYKKNVGVLDETIDTKNIVDNRPKN